MESCIQQQIQNPTENPIWRNREPNIESSNESQIWNPHRILYRILFMYIHIILIEFKMESYIESCEESI